MKTLQHTVAITFPESRCGDATFDTLCEQLVSVAGGGTSVDGNGCWIDIDGKACTERVIVATVHYTNADKPAISAIVDAIVLRLLQLGEQAVLIKDDDFAYVYYQSDKKGLEP